jgi:rhodanese-related sulfurtransferase
MSCSPGPSIDLITYGMFLQVFTFAKPGLDAAAPIVKQTTETVTKAAGPLASDVAQQAQKALKNAGVNTDSGVEFAKSAVDQTSKVLEGVKPTATSVLESALSADPLFLAEAAGGLILFYFLAPPLVGVIFNPGYAGDLGAAEALDRLLKENYTLIDIRTEKEKERSGIPSLPSSSKNKYVAIPLEDFPGKIKSQLRNSSKVEAEVVAIKIAALKKLNKGSKIVLIDESGKIAKTVARTLKSQGFKNTFVIKDGFKGGKGWIQSRLGTDDYSSTGFSFSEVVSPSRIIPAGTKRLGTSSSGSNTSRFKLLPGGVSDE